MRTKILIGVALFLIALLPGALPSAQATPSTTSEIDQPAQASVLKAYARLPLLFIHNQGQLDSQVEYYVKTPGQTVYLTPSGMVFDLVRYHNTETTDAAERLAFSLDLVDANTSPVIEGRNKDGAVVNYLIGNDPQKWHTDIPTYREVIYNEVYPGIDLRLYGKEGYLEYEFIVQPGANVSDIALAYAGVNSLYMDSGELVVSTAFGDLNQSQPYIYQPIGDDQIAVAGGFRLLGAKSYGFEVGAYDAGYPLIIDPSLTLAYSTYLGGSGSDYGYGIAVESGYAYVTGWTGSTGFPTSTSPYQTDQGSTDAFVVKLDTAQSGVASLIYSTYLGGSSADSGYSIAVESGCAYVTGDTLSSDFPLFNQYQTHQIGYDAFVAKLNTSGNGLLYSTYLGGNGGDTGNGIAAEAGYAYVMGTTQSGDFPIRNQYQTNQTGDDVFVTKIDTTKSSSASLIYSTYLGGSGNDIARGIAVESGYAYVTGYTASSDFPTLNHYQTDQTGTDAFVSKIDTSQTGNASLIYSTYLGGGSTDEGLDIAVESEYAYVTGDTVSSDFPTLNHYQTDQTGTDAFVAKLNTTGNGLVYSTYLGGSGSEGGDGIAVESVYAYITGNTASNDFPSLNQYQAYGGGLCDAFVTKLDTIQSGNASLVYSTYLGGGGNDQGWDIAVESRYAYVTGQTNSTDFPTRNQYQTYQTIIDVFVTKFNGIGGGTDEIGVWRGSTRYFYLDVNGNGIYNGTATERFGPFLSSTDATDVPVAGNW